MANRPAQLCTLQKNLSIGAQKSFADTFNWLVSCMKNLRGGRGVTVKWQASDTPEVSLSGGGGGGNSYTMTGTRFGSFALNMDTKTIAHGVVIVGRKPILVYGIDDIKDGSYRIKITLGTGVVAEVEKGSGFDDPRDENISYVPLYEINGNNVVDYRFAVVAQCWE